MAVGRSFASYWKIIIIDLESSSIVRARAYIDKRTVAATTVEHKTDRSVYISVRPERIRN